MSDQDRPREEMRTASDLWPKRQRPAAEAEDPSSLAAELEQQPSVPPSGTSDLRPPSRHDSPIRRPARPGVSVNDVAQSADLRPGRPIDAPMRRESRGGPPESRDLQERVERIQQATGQVVGERRPPITGIKSLTTPAYSPPPYSPPRAAVPPRPDQTAGDQSPRPPLGSYPAGSQPQDPANRPGSGMNAAPTDPSAPGNQPSTAERPAAPWQEQPGVGQRPTISPGPGGPPWQGGPTQNQNQNQNQGQYQQPWPGQPPTTPPKWGTPAPPPQQWQGQSQGQPQAPYGQQPWTGGPPNQAPWEPGPNQPGYGPSQYAQPQYGQPGYGQPWAGPVAQPIAPPVRMAGSGQAPWGLREISLIVVGGLLFTIALLFVALGILDGAGYDTTDDLDPVVFLALGSTMYLGFGAAIWGVLIAWRKLTWADLGFRRTKLSSILWMIPLSVGVLVIVSIVGLTQEWLFDISPPEDSGLPIEEGNLTAGSVFAAALVAVILAPIFEELFFRGVLFQYLRSRYLLVARGLFEAVVLSALAFASLHLGGAILPILPVGVILALVMHRTNSLWPAIALHCFYNGIVLAISLATLT